MTSRATTTDAAAPELPVDVVLDAALRDVGGRPTTLRAHLPAGRPLVIVFVRHFG